MVMQSDNGIRIDENIKYPEWVKDDVDKILCELLTGEREYTITVIKKIVLEELVKKVSQGITLNDKLNKLVEKEILKQRDKETTIKLFSINKE